jgi:hypothetical protein
MIAIAAPGPLAEAAPAGGAAADQVAIATAMATVATAALLWLIFNYRRSRGGPLARLARTAQHVAGIPAWAALPLAVGGGSLMIALLGMYWDIALHVDNGRDEGPLANPSHYLILIGLYGVFAAGVLSMALPERGTRPGPASVRIASGWHAPVGGLLIACCGAFALLGFPLDDIWHRLFGQDVTLWSPTHMMLFGGAGLTLIGMAVLLAEGMHARGDRPGTDTHVSPLVRLRRLGLLGGLLVGLSTFQGEFDFGIAQYRMIFQPMLIALAAGMALVAARIWIGRGGALGAALMFLVVRGVVALIVAVIFGQTMPAQPLYLVEALCVEVAALALARRPLALGVVGGLLCGTVGLAAEWGWTQLVYPLPWNGGMLPEALIVAPLAGLAGGLLGALLGAGVRLRLPAPPVARAAALSALAIIAGLTAYGLAVRTPADHAATVTLRDVPGERDGRHVAATVRLSPSTMADGAIWVTVTAWQGGGLVVDRMEKIGEGVYRTTKPIPVYGNWKSLIRVHNGRSMLGAPIFLPEDPALPNAREVPALPQFTRAFVRDQKILMREQKEDVPSWLWTTASLVVLALALVFVAALSWGVARVARSGAQAPPGAGSAGKARAPHRPALGLRGG